MIYKTIYLKRFIFQKYFYKKRGRIIDVEFDPSSGYMIKFVIERAHFVRSLFYSTEELTIKFTQIKKMGEDVILIDIS